MNRHRLRARTTALALLLALGVIVAIVAARREGAPGADDGAGGSRGADPGRPLPGSTPSRAEADLAVPPAARHSSPDFRAPDDPRTPAAPAEIDHRPFVGRVVDREGHGVGRAHVRFGVRQTAEFGSGEVETGPDGTFRAALDDAGSTVEALAWAKGLAAADGAVGLKRGESADLLVVEGGEVRVLVVEAGTAVPIAEASVRILAGDDTDEAAWDFVTTASPAAVATTDARGRAVLYVPIGRCQAVVVPRDHGPAVSAVVAVGIAGTAIRVEVAAGARLAGRVTDEAGKPIEGASVTAITPGLIKRSTKTTGDGRYEMRALPSPSSALDGYGMPSFFVDAQAPGFAPRRRLPTLPSPGSSVSCDFALVAARRVTGRVVGPDGEPAAVRLSRSATLSVTAEDGEEYAWTEWPRVEVDAEGRFSIADVAGDEITLRADAATGGALATRALPIVRDAIVFRLPTLVRQDVVIRVLDAAGAPVRGVAVRVPARPDGWNSLASGATDATGEVKLGVPGTGSVFVVIDPADGPTIRATTRREEGGRERATVRLPSGEIEGVVRLLDGTPVAADLVLERSPDVGGYVYCRGVSGSDGRFRFRHVPDAEYLVRAKPQDEWARTGTGESVRPGQGPVSLWVVSSKEADAMRPRFRLVDAVTGTSTGPGTHVDVDARHLDGPHRGSSVVVSVDADGAEFVARGIVPPGAYRLEIWQAGYVPVVLDRVVFPRVGPPPEIRLRRGATVKGRLVGAQGKPGHPGTVSIGPNWTRLSHDGEYELEGVGPGRAEVVFDSEPTGEVRVSVTIPAVGEVVVDAQGPPGGVLLIGFGDSPEHSLDLRVEPVAGGAFVTPRKRENESIWVASPLPAGRYRVRCVFDGLELPAREVDVSDGADTELTFEVPTSPR